MKADERNDDRRSSVPLADRDLSMHEEIPSQEKLIAFDLTGPLAIVERWLFNATRFLTVTCLLLLLASLTWTMIRRQVGGIAVPDEFVTLLFTWMLFIGAAALVRDWNHIEVPMIQEFLPTKRWRLLHHAVLILVSLLFLWIYLRSSLALISGATNRTSPMLQLPQIYWYGSLLVSAALMIFYSVLRLVLIAVALFHDPRHDQAASG